MIELPLSFKCQKKLGNFSVGVCKETTLQIYSSFADVKRFPSKLCLSEEVLELLTFRVQTDSFELNTH